VVGVKINRSTLPRNVKLLMDRGMPYAEASATIGRSGIFVVVDPAAARSRVGQIASIIAIATASRAFGRVAFMVAVDAPLGVRSAGAATLREALTEVGGVEGELDYPMLYVGETVPPPGTHGVRVVLSRTSGGVAPADATEPFDVDGYAPAAVLGASLAASELFLENVLLEPASGRTRIFDMLPTECRKPIAELDLVLPKRISFLGVGHLGQAAIFVASLLGSVDDKRSYALQDVDVIQPANASTQLLVSSAQSGPKTAACAAWLAARGIGSVVRPEKFGLHSNSVDGDPDVYIAGFDNAEARCALGVLSPALVIDGGIGSHVVDFTAFRVHVFPQHRLAEEVFRTQPDDLAAVRERAQAAADFAASAKNDEEKCGLIEAAGAASGVPFVGTAVAALALSEAIRFAAGLPVDAVVSGDLRWSHVATAARDAADIAPGRVA
jgi:hypothetical protein